jgi:uncharacterized protein involved in exopolysaccharide biosynthesis
MAGGERATDGGIAAELERAVASSGALAYIIVFEGEAPRRIYVMSRNAVVVGRDEAAELRIVDGSVSGQHARITSRGRTFEIEDLGSTNGTSVGGNRVDRATLENGDRVTLGTTELMFLLERPTTATVRLPDDANRPSRRSGPSAVVAQAASPVHLAPALAHHNREPEELSLVEIVNRAARLFDFIRRKMVLIVVLAGAGTALALLSTVPFPPAVTVSSEVKLLPHMSLAPNPGQDRWGPSDEGSTAFVKEAEKAVTQPDLMRATLLKVTHAPALDASVGDAIRRIKVEEVGDHLLRVTYAENASRGPSPRNLLSTLLQGFVQGQIDRALREYRAKVDFLRDQLSSAQKELGQIGEERERFRSMNVDRLPEDASQTHNSRYALESRRGELLAHARELEAELAGEQAQLKTDRPAAQTRFQWSESYRTSLAEVNRKLSEAYARGLKDSHPEVKQLVDERQRLQALERDELQATPSTLVRESDPNYQQVQRRIDRLRAELSSTRAGLSETERSLTKVRQVVDDLPRVEQRMSDLNHRQEATQQLHSELFAKMKQAEIQLNLEKVSAESRYDVSPVFEYRPRLTRILALRAAVGLILGLLLAAMVLLFQEARKTVRHALAISAQSPQTTTIPMRRDRSRGSRA